MPSDLPLLLILAVDGPEQLGAHDDDEPDSLYCARNLVAAELASWHPLAAVTVEDLRRWIGPVRPDVLRGLVKVTGGRAAYAGKLWEDWRRHGVVEDETDGRWRFTAIGRKRAVGDMFDERLKRLVGSDLGALVGARRLLLCAALEGRRFTADAVALALGRDRDRDRDDVIDVLDDTLALDDERPDGLVIEDGSIIVNDQTGERHLWLYRFDAELDWLTLYYRLTDADRPVMSLRLANAIRAVYGGQSHRVAHTLTRLYEMGRDADAARHYRHMGDIGVSRDTILWRTHAVLDSPDPEDRVERRRAAQILIAAAAELFHGGPFNDGFQFAQAALRLAVQKRDQAKALYQSGAHRTNLGDLEHAGCDLRRALGLWCELGDRVGEASTRHALANIDFELGEYDKARGEYLALLEILRGLGERDGEASTRYKLAAIDLELGEYDKARSEYLAVLELRRELGDRAAEARTRHQLAGIDFELGEYDKARSEYLAVLELGRELGDRAAEARTRHQLASIDFELREYDKARSEYLAVLELWRELGGRGGEASALYQLAAIDFELGEYDKARSEYLAVLELKRELGDRYGEARTLYQLAGIDFWLGEYDKARNALLALLELQRELGDHRGEATARDGLTKQRRVDTPHNNRWSIQRRRSN